MESMLMLVAYFGDTGSVIKIIVVRFVLVD